MSVVVPYEYLSELYPPEKLAEFRKRTADYALRDIRRWAVSAAYYFWSVGWPAANLRFACAIGNHSWNLGFVVHTWGLRVMLGWWHICISFR